MSLKHSGGNIKLGDGALGTSPGNLLPGEVPTLLCLRAVLPAGKRAGKRRSPA